MNPAATKLVSRVEKSRALVRPVRPSGWASLPADRSFKVLQPSRESAQLSLFPPPGQVMRPARHGR
ncbi:MAG: hypothetical protein ABI605_15235 [Rhizobacter sp.]